MASTELNPSDQLKALIHAGSVLVGTTKNRTEDSVKTLDNVVASRLREFSHAASSAPDLKLSLDTIENRSLEELKLLTAQKSLEVLERVQTLLQEYDADLPESNKESATPQVAIGTRDLGVLRTLASVVFGWGTTPSLVVFYSDLSAEPSNPSETTTTLKSFLKRTSSMLWLKVSPGAGTPSTRLFPSHITKIFITAHITDLLRVGISLGWMSQPDKEARETVIELLKILPASQAIVSLGAVGQPVRSEAGTTPVQVPVYVQKASSGLLSRQVLRPDGVSGLCAAVFGEGEEVAPLVKLERIARVLGAVPSQMDREAYMRMIIPRLINLLGPVSSDFQSQSVPTSYKQAAAFTLARMLTTSKPLAIKVISPVLHARFLPTHSALPPALPPEPPSLSVEDAVATLTTLFTSTDPSPLLAQTILAPILVPLYNLSAHLDAQRVSDPMLKESTRGLIRTWARLVGHEEAVTGLWNIVLGVDGWGVGDEGKRSWDVGEEGLEIAKAGPPKPIPLSVLQGPDERGELGDEEDDNPLSLRPNPKHFSELVKTLERKDVASAVFVKTLNAYQATKAVDTEPLKVLLYLRLILEMQQRIGSSVFTEPEHVLQFVAHAIEPKEAEGKLSQGSGMDALRIVEDDSDDEHEQEEPGTKDDMTLTAVTLLLSILEANEKLSTTTSPLLAMIFDYLEPITSSEDEAIRTVAREARLVLISRRSIIEATPTSTDAQRPQLETYQEALRLIQDPILPVRAHGLHMLRQLVDPSNPTKDLPELNPALVPGILDVFLQSVQEEDSFVFLNAVQGLSAMVNRLGREILQSLVRIYADGVEPGRTMERAELDKRVRIGEAFVQVVRSCGNALGLYVDMLVPPLFRVVRTGALPTILRSSALAILAQCVETSPPALTAWKDELMSGMLDIIQLESVQAVPLSRKAREEARAKQGEDKQKLDDSVDSRPQDVDSKLPPLRRSALLCFALIVRSMVEGIYEGAQPMQWDGLRSRALTLLEYVRVTDSDSVVRTQAAETLALVKQLGRAELGLDV